MEDSTNFNQFNSETNSKFVLLKMSRDMNFISIIGIIYGAIQSISIIGAVVGLPIIFACLRLKEAAEAFRHFSSTEDKNALSFAFEKQARSFEILRILIIVSLIFYGLLIIALLFILIPFISNWNHYDFK